MKLPVAIALCLASTLLRSSVATAADYALPAKTPGDRMLVETFRVEAEKLSSRCLAEVKSLGDWKARRDEYRHQLSGMLGLDPLPARGDLKATVTSKVERDDFTVENLHFQSSPGLYVTANLYLPKDVSRPAPTVLYLSGHGPVISNGVSYGNKVSYQHHGTWFARNGYVCLVVDTLQLGEILGLHHGTYRENLWWWNSRGYTPAGVEAWNCIRALDYLSTRPEVDTNRFGATGRSGGGAYSWWIAALDERIKAVAPVAGITDLHNHVIDGTVEGHCDCMFTVNTHRWDYAQVAALVAPRPLLIVNTDADSIFPLDGVVRLHSEVRRIYELHSASTNLGLVIAPGPHKDTQDLQVPVFRWFNTHLKGEDPLIEMAAVKLLTPQQLKVFATLPPDAKNTNVHATFVPAAGVPPVPRDRTEWLAQSGRLKREFKEKSLAGWPSEPGPLRLERKFTQTESGLTLQGFDFDSEPTMRLRLYVLSHAGVDGAKKISLRVLDAMQWSREFGALETVFGDSLAEEVKFNDVRTAGTSSLATVRKLFAGDSKVIVFFAPRGIGLNAWSVDRRREVQVRRRFMLLGQTLDSMRAWDIKRACQAVRLVPSLRSGELELMASGSMAINAACAGVFESAVDRLELIAPSGTFAEGPDYLNALRVLDVPQLITLATERCRVSLVCREPGEWDYPSKVAALNNARFSISRQESGKAE